MAESIEDVTTEVGQLAPGFLRDEEIVSRVLAGDLASLELVLRRYNQRLFRIVRGILGDDETEDVLQETYVRAYEHLEQFAGRLTEANVKVRLHRARAGRSSLLAARTM